MAERRRLPDGFGIIADPASASCAWGTAALTEPARKERALTARGAVA
jgi:hypothetical protein